MREALGKQEYEDLMSAVSIAIEHAPNGSPNFKRALERLSKKLWRDEVREHCTATTQERVLRAIRDEVAEKASRRKK